MNFNDFMQYCFIMNRTEYDEYVKSEAYEYNAATFDEEITLEDIKKSIFDVYREYDPETNFSDDIPHLYTKEQAWDEVGDYANEGIYSLEEFAEAIYDKYLTLQSEEEEEEAAD